ncbi:MFS transporter [Christensenellaceae bacterium NSJ-44]|uniref:MFS transporter n=1 Tax=Luoshenia tenuis TaxID=2763654 RepID=A0A926D1R9_9FIRM|nr:MFS transporter [Luoshenia tenuis]MBC8529678.1 MFS transporter [Luoshenia tenuis]
MEKARPKLFTPSFILVTPLSCITTICLQMTVSAMPLFVVALGVEQSLAGSATTACTLAALLARPFATALVDRIGGKKTAFAGIALYVGVFAAYFLCDNLPLMLALRILQGAGLGLITTALGTVATAMVPPENLTRGMSYFSLGNAVALSAGPALGLVLAQAGFQYLFWVGAAASLLCLGLLLLVHYDHAPQPKGPKGGFWQKAVRSGAILPSGILVIFILCQTALSTYLAFFAASLGVGGASAFFTVNVFGLVLSKFALGRLCDRFGDIPVAVGSGILLVTAYALIALTPALGEPGIWSAGLLYGFGYSGLYTLLNVSAVRHAGPDTRGAANSLFFGAKDVGSGVGAMAWGLFLGLGYAGLYWVATGLAAATVAWYVWYLKKERTRAGLPAPAQPAAETAGP